VPKNRPKQATQRRRRKRKRKANDDDVRAQPQPASQPACVYQPHVRLSFQSDQPPHGRAKGETAGEAEDQKISRSRSRGRRCGARIFRTSGRGLCYETERTEHVCMMYVCSYMYLCIYVACICPVRKIGTTADRDGGQFPSARACGGFWSWAFPRARPQVLASGRV